MNLAVPRTLAVALTVAFLAFPAGLLAWLWVGEWRWALTGLVTALVALLIGAAVTKPPAA